MACGHPATGAAAHRVLAAGGNAFDAVVAAGFAAAVAEPTLTSLGGGGFALTRTAAGSEVLFDFFVDTPGLGEGAAVAEPHFVAVTVRFPGADQVFHAGRGAAAVPGCLAGYLHLHARLGRLPLADVVRPAVALARDGVALNRFQAYVVQLLTPILTLEPPGAALFAPGGAPLVEGDRYANPATAAFLERLGTGAAGGFDDPATAVAVAADMAAGAGLVTAADLAAYRIVERDPLAITYRGHRVLTNPPPAFGGELVALGLVLLDERGPEPSHGSADHLVALVQTMIEADAVRAAGTVGERLRSSGGTTHVSVADGEGNVAAMTTSNGEGSGYLVPGTGVMLNNMLGEDDLHPDGFHAAAPGRRVSSMMAPTVVIGPDGEVALALGSGGSKRIRTALLQVISAVVDHGLDPVAAVTAPRLHWDGEQVHAEPGFAAASLAAVAERWPVNAWTARDLYFGGAHAVRPGRGGVAAGDPRRGGWPA
ncbi:gamma-glutamyltransferase [soil metagenome]